MIVSADAAAFSSSCLGRLAPTVADATLGSRTQVRTVTGSNVKHRMMFPIPVPAVGNNFCFLFQSENDINGDGIVGATDFQSICGPFAADLHPETAGDRIRPRDRSMAQRAQPLHCSYKRRRMKLYRFGRPFACVIVLECRLRWRLWSLG